MVNKEKNFISAVIYIHNNESVIEDFFNSINEFLKSKFEKYEIIFVNDCSVDNSIEVLKNRAKVIDDTNITIINMSYYHGLELSMVAGMDFSIGDFVYEFDDISRLYEVDLLFNLYMKSLEGFDIVSAIPLEKNNVKSTIFYKIFNKYSNTQYKIQTNYIRILSRRAINRINSLNKFVPYRKPIYANCGLKYYSYDYTVSHKCKRKFTKEQDKNRRELGMNSLILFTDIAFKTSWYLSLIAMLCILGTIIYTISMYLSGIAIAGWTTMMLFSAFAFFGLFVILAFILKYLSLITSLIFKDKKYSFESIEKVSK